MNKKFSKSIAAMLSALSISTSISTSAVVIGPFPHHPTWPRPHTPYTPNKGLIEKIMNSMIETEKKRPKKFVDKVRDFKFIYKNLSKNGTDLKILTWGKTYDSFASNGSELVKKISDLITLKVIEKNKEGIEEEKFVPLNKIVASSVICNSRRFFSLFSFGLCEHARLIFNKDFRINFNNLTLLDKDCQDENLKGKSDLEKVHVSGRDFYIDAKNKMVFSIEEGFLTVADARIYAAMALDSKSTPEEISFANTVKERCKIPYVIESEAKVKNYFCRSLQRSSLKIPCKSWDFLNDCGIRLKELGGEKRTIEPYFEDNFDFRICGVFTSNEVEFEFDENLWKENDFSTKNGEKKKVYVNKKNNYVVSVPYDKKIDVTKEKCDVEVWDLSYAIKSENFPDEILRG